MIVHLFLISGTVIFFFGILGTIILPDIMLRFHAATKCGVTGTVNILIGIMIHSKSLDFVPKLGLILVFIFISAPLVAHVLAVTYFDAKMERDNHNKIEEKKSGICDEV